MRLSCYALHDHAPTLRAARSQRPWMDRFRDRHPYRCLPLSIANAHGWEALCPAPIEIEWNGGPEADDLTIRALKPLPGGRPADYFCRSHFTRGVVTFHLDYLLQTEPGWALLATGPFNQPKDNIYPLTGVVETDWLPYPFTMNWQVLRPGRVMFEEGEPFCFFFPVDMRSIADCTPEIRRLSDEPELNRQHEAFRASREEFKQRIHAGDAASIKQAWQKHYFVGRHPDGTKIEEHVNKLRLQDPVDSRGTTEASIHAQSEAELMTTHPAEPMWAQDSLLNAIEQDQTADNQSGRRRIDREGCLTDWSNTYVVRSQADAEGCDFLVVDDLLTDDQCEALVRTFADLSDRVFKSDAIDPYWNNRFIWFADIAAARPDAGAIMADAQKRAIGFIKEFYQLRSPIYPDLLQIVRWKPGMFMPAHADNANPDHSEHQMAYRDLSGIVYLNDDYEGGELYFTALDIAVKPKRGMFVAFAAGFHHEHAVLRVGSGTRLTMPSFFTFKREKADPRLLEGMAA